MTQVVRQSYHPSIFTSPLPPRNPLAHPPFHPQTPNA
jgi:hypothetical protein